MLKILTLDIETHPNTVYTYRLYDKNPIPIGNLVEPSYVLCYSAKWFDSPDIITSDLISDGAYRMAITAAELLDEADVVISYNGKRFDIPVLNTLLIDNGLTPPSDFRQVDLYPVVRRRFDLPSYKLDYVTKRLKVETKASNVGLKTFIDAGRGDVDAMSRLVDYNRQDVIATDSLYNLLRPWILNHPSHCVNLEPGEPPTCPTCGGSSLEHRGFAYTNLGKFQRYWCRDCGKWSRDGKNLAGSNLNR